MGRVYYMLAQRPPLEVSPFRGSKLQFQAVSLVAWLLLDLYLKIIYIADFQESKTKTDRFRNASKSSTVSFTTRLCGLCLS